MGVYIKGMEMPKSCYKCEIRRRDGMDIVCPVAHERFSTADVNILEYRLDSCPLIPVPPHGKLFDADAILQEATKGEEPFDWIDKNELLRLFFDAPTIIPAEEEMK